MTCGKPSHTRPILRRRTPGRFCGASGAVTEEVRRLVKSDQISIPACSKVEVWLWSRCIWHESRFAGRSRPGEGSSAIPSLVRSVHMMAPEKGPNRLNMKFTDCGRRVVIHLVRGLPPKIVRDKKTITIIFPEQRATYRKLPKAQAR